MAKPIQSIQELQTLLEKNRQELGIVENNIFMHQWCIHTCTTQLTEKEKELELHKEKYFQFFRKTTTERLQNEIKTLQEKISDVEKKKKHQETIKEKLTREIERDEESLFVYGPKGVWEGYPPTLDEKVVTEYAELFKEFIKEITPEEPFINIVMIGETGAGKSSLINTFATALAKKEYIKDTYRISPEQTKDKEKSATKRLHLEPLFLDDPKKLLYIRFYDVPGISANVGKEELDMVIDGQLKPNVKMEKKSEMKRSPQNFRPNPTSADKVHCILYVLKASSNLSTVMSRSLEIIHQIRNDRKDRKDEKRQFVIVTSIDEIGVPKDDIKSAYRYECVLKLCQKISYLLDFDLTHVIPVSNYCGEVAPNAAKNAMSLIALWRVCISSKEYIERRRQQTPANFWT